MPLYRTLIIASRPTQRSLLESAASSPINQHRYTRAEGVLYLAAVLAQKMMLHHSFPDGHKRSSVVAADWFLGLNGFQLTQGEESNFVWIEAGATLVSGKAQLNVCLQVPLADAHIAMAGEMWDEEELARALPESRTALAQRLAGCVAA